MLSLSKNFLAYDQARFCSLTLAFPPQASQATFKAVLFLAVDMAKAPQTKCKRRFGSPRLILNGFWKITCQKKAVRFFHWVFIANDDFQWLPTMGTTMRCVQCIAVNSSVKHLNRQCKQCIAVDGGWAHLLALSSWNATATDFHNSATAYHNFISHQLVIRPSIVHQTKSQIYIRANSN